LSGQFGIYDIVQPLGAGGMARVDIAEDRSTGKQVALKRLLPAAAADEDLVRSFIAEAKLVSELRHPNIAQTLAFGHSDGEYFMSMELVRGPTLVQLVRHCNKTVGEIPVSIIIHVLRHVCHALEYAHGRTDSLGRSLGIIHRDVSPANIVISTTGLVKLIDFGIAKVKDSSMKTRAGIVKGKMGYISPEYLAGKIDARADLWSLGVVAYELLTRRRLFDGEGDFDVLRKVRDLPIVPPSQRVADLPPELDAIVMTALQRDPEQRWQNAGAMRTALGGLGRELGSITNRQVIEWVEWALAQTERPAGRADTGAGADKREVADEPSEPSIIIE
jgi:serine/threonine-protein kinase